MCHWVDSAAFWATNFDIVNLGLGVHHMTNQFRNGVAALVAVAAFGSAGAAHADYAFSGSGPSGTLVAPSETWAFNFHGGAAGGGGLNNWGSPGVGEGIVPYGEAMAAYGMTLTFTGGGTINAASVLTGNAAACSGGSGGGTTFCTIAPKDIWFATITGPSSISFIAQNPSFYLSTGQKYFVNVFFDGATPTDFTGAWLTTFSGGVPEPSTWALMLLGFGAVGYAMRRRRTAALAA